MFIPIIQIDYGDFRKNCFETFRLQKRGEISIKSIFWPVFKSFQFFSRKLKWISKNEKDTFVANFMGFQNMYDMWGRKCLWRALKIVEWISSQNRIFQNPSLWAKMRPIRLRILCWSRLYGREWQIHSLTCLTFA